MQRELANRILGRIPLRRVGGEEVDSRMTRESKWKTFRRASEDFQRIRIERLRCAELLLPPWIGYSDVARGSIAWRMGEGESYLMDWYVWIRALSKERRKAYEIEYPEPESWEGTYAILPSRDAAKTWDAYWDEAFDEQKRIIDSQVQLGRTHDKM